ncbi:hypothetical protein MLD38_013493 [Melastoma candidum]|uniref:Uncharacterized protein n=2 Tax=Melastoma candidum TaxID=119954 RepID=A0ACB9R9D3_9MYRT|nr:hypothetical protein MLD38_013490 [Melastoma candidum]KAI4375645.1 hypothetical protein MLD38_013493 [Melastoma candidum]
MAKLASFLMFVVVFATFSHEIARALIPCPIPIDILLCQTTTVTKIRFYMHGSGVGGNETAYRIANSSITNQSPTMFGFLDIFDNLLTETPDPTSNTVGRMQGFFASADLNEFATYNSYNVYFTSGVYNGSTINIAGRDPVLSDNRELFVSGGTLYFRLATGIVTLRTIPGDNVTTNTVFEYNVTVIHPIA